MAAARSSKLLARVNGVLGLFIGIFGALAILGVFFKIAKYPNYELFMAIGFFGEAAAFVIMGIVAFFTGFAAKDDEPQPGRFAGADVSSADLDAALRASADEFRESMRAASEDYRASMKAMLQDHLGGDLEALARSVQEDVQHFGAGMRGLGSEMERARAAVQAMSAEMESVATGTLADDAELLGRGMRQLSEGMAEAGSTVDRMRADLNEMASRFHAFNGLHRAQENGRSPENGFGVPVTSRNEKSGVA